MRCCSSHAVVSVHCVAWVTGPFIVNVPIKNFQSSFTAGDDGSWLQHNRYPFPDVPAVAVDSSYVSSSAVTSTNFVADRPVNVLTSSTLLAPHVPDDTIRRT